MKNPITRVIIWLSVFALLPVGGCSDDETVAPDPNKPPTITFTTDKLAVPRSTDVTLTVDVDDPDGDPVAVNWAVTRDGQPSGTLREADQGQPSMTWTAPEETGSDTITAVATDGKGGSSTLVETIQVGTLHTERITLNRTWGLDTSPHIILGNGTHFVIDARTTLTVNPGVELIIDRPGLEVSVVGRLDINGESDAPVAIRPNSRSAEPGYWKGLTGSPSSSIPRIELDHTTILYATDAVKANIVAEAHLDGCTIMFSLESAVLHGSSGGLHVYNTAITNNEKSGIRIQRIIELDEPMTVDIRGNRIALNGDTSGETVYTDQAGIYIDLPDPLRLADIQIMENYISFNGVPGIHLEHEDAVYPEIHQNEIRSNEFGKDTDTEPRWNIKLGEGFSGVVPTIDARDNYWGGAVAEEDSMIIKNAILDSERRANWCNVLVVIYPWLNIEP